MIALLSVFLLAVPQERVTPVPQEPAARVAPATPQDPPLGPPMVLDISRLTRVDRIAELRERMGDISLGEEERMEAYRDWMEHRDVARTAEQIAESLAFVASEGGEALDVTAFRDQRALAIRGTIEQKRLCLQAFESMAVEERMLLVTATIHRVPVALVADLLEGRPWVGLSDTERKALTVAINAAGGEVVNAPRVVVLSGARAEISVLDETAYVSDYKVVAAGDVQIADPVIEVVQAGITLDVLGVALKDRVRMRVGHRFAELEEPIPTEELVVTTTGNKVTIQKPKVHTIEIESTFDVGPDGGTVALAAAEPRSVKDGGSGQGVVVILQVETLTAAPPESGGK